MTKKASEYQRAFRERMAESHERVVLWVPREDYERAMALGQRLEIVNTMGRNPGQVNMQKVLQECIRQGIVTMERDLAGTNNENTK